MEKEKEKIEKLERYRYNPIEFIKHYKTLKNGYKPIMQFIVIKEGNLLSNSTSKAEEFRKYFNELLNSESSVNQEDDEGMEETSESCKKMKNWNLAKLKYKWLLHHN